MRTRLALLSVLLFGLSARTHAPAQPPAPVKTSALEAVPTDSFAFLTVNVGKLWDKPGFKPLRDWFDAQKTGPADELFGVPAGDIERVTLFMPSVSATDRDRPMALVTTKKAYNEAKVVKALQVEGRDSGTRRAGRAIRLDDEPFRLLVFVDDRTLLFLPKDRDGSAAEYLGQLLAKKTDGPLARALADADKHDLALAVDARSLGALLEPETNRELTPYLVLFKARTLAFAMDFDKTVRGYMKIEFPSEADAKRAGPVLKEALTDLVAVLEKEIARRKDRRDLIQQYYDEMAVAVLKAAKVESGGSNVLASGEVPYQDAIAKFAAALPKSYSAAVTSAKGQNHLKQLGVAMHNFEATTNNTPSDVTRFGAKRLPMSWRVQILPYIEQDNLYKQLDMTKAWDDPVNLKVLEKVEMPKVFEIPGRPAPKGHTYFRVFSMPKNAKGKHRPWLTEGQFGPRFSDITDGTANTFMIVEARDAVPWYKPDVLGYDGELPLPPLGDKDADKFHVCFGDGRVMLLRRDKFDEKTLRALITVQGGEVVNLPVNRGAIHPHSLQEARP